MIVRIKFVIADRDRHGKVRLYFRRRGFRKMRLPDDPSSEAFLAMYHAAVAETEAGRPPCPPPKPRPGAITRAQPGTIRAIVAGYVSSAGFVRLNKRTQRVRRQILESCCQEPIAPDKNLTFGDMPIDRFTPKMVRILRDRKSEAPESANSRIKALRQAFVWAIEFEHATTNPAMDVSYISTGSTGFKTWTIEDVEKYRAHWPLGTKPRLAMEIMLLLGVRRSDAVRLGKQHVRGDVVRFTPMKGSSRTPQMLELPILPDLAAALAAGPTGDLTWIVTHTGQPYTAEGFGNWFKRQCDAAGLEGCSAHGLRKAGATAAAENGADPFQLMAIFGWRTIKEAERYTRAARQRTLAAAGMAKIQAKERGP